MAVRIQLSSNFQVVELTYSAWNDVNNLEINQAAELVNLLGSQVTNEPKQKGSSKKRYEELATKGQVSYLVGLGLDESEAKNMSKTEAWEYINKHRED